MNTLYDIVLNTILILFPILIYFVYCCYKSLRYEKYENLIFYISLITSLYLCLKFGNISINSKTLLFCNVPIVIAYLRKKDVMAIVLSLISVLYCYYIYKINVDIMMIKYLSYFIIYFLANKRKVKDNNFIMLIAVLQGFFISFEYFFITGSGNMATVFELFLVVLIYYIITFIIVFLFKLINNITSLYLTVAQLEREKQIKDSLFKLTHEIKNPIAVCKGYLDMLDLNKKEDSIRYISIIKQEIDRSLNIMTDFMQFNKIKIDKELIDISLLLDDVYDGLKIFLNGHNIKLIYQENEEDIYIMADYDRMKQVIINIVKNAVEAIKEEGQIKISSKKNKTYSYIIIEDNGCGMDKETLNRMTEMFFTTKDKGSGLGLTLSNEIINAHNGTLKYESEVNKGTKVTIKIPLAPLKK